MAKRITEKIRVNVVYIPKGYLDEYDDYELIITINNDSHTITPYGPSAQKDMTVNEILQEVKELLSESVITK